MLVLDLALLTSLAFVPQAIQKVNGRLATDPTQGGGSVSTFQLGSQGTRLFLAGDLLTDDHGELWSVPFAGGPLARLSAFTRPEPELEIVVRSVPGRRLAVFWADPDTDRVHELFVVPDDGHAAPLRLHASLASGQTTGQDFLVSGDRVVFRSNFDGDFDFELHSAPLDASTPPVLLSGTLVAGGSLGFSAFQDGILGLAPTGDRAVYLADARIDGRTELFSVPIDGSAAPTRLSANLVAGGQVQRFLFTPDGARVLYVADANTAGRLELYSVPTAGGPVTPVSAPPVPGGGLWFHAPAIGAGGTRVVYTADARTDGVFELFSAPVDGSAAPTPLSSTMVAGGLVSSFRLTADGAQAVYQADQAVDERYELWVVPVDGSAAARPLLGATFAGPAAQTLSDVSATHAVCLADEDHDGRPELYLARLDGSQAPLLLTRTPHGVSEVAELSPDGARVWFLATGALQRGELFGLPVDGSAPPVRLSPPLPPGGKVLLPRFRADGALAFLCDAGGLDQYSAWTHTGSVLREVTPALPPAPVVGDVSAYAWSPGATHILYGADRYRDRMASVTSVSLRAGTESLTPETDGIVLSILFPPGGERFAYTRFSVGDFFPYPANTSLFSAPLDAAEAALHVTGDTSIGSVLFPDREHAVVDLTSSGYRSDPEGRLVQVALDGSEPQRELSPPLGRPSGVFPTALAPRARRAVFGVSDFSTGFGPHGLYSARLDVELPPERIDLASHAQPQVRTLLVRPQDELALFVADLAVPGRFELFAVPADGSQAPRRLHAPLPPGAEVLPGLRLTPDGAHVVFVADARLDNAFELYVTRVADGLTLPLSGPLVAGGDILAQLDPEPNVWISPDGARVVYLADQAVDEVVECWSVRLDASAPPVRLHAPLSGALDALPEPHFTPDGARVVFPLERTLDGVVELVIAPTDASAPPTVLNAPFPPGGGLKTSSGPTTRGSLALAPGGRHAFYLAEQDVDGVVELHSVALDASAPPLRWNAPLVSGGNVVSFALRPTPGAVLYLADQDEDETYELYLASFPDAPPGRAASAAPTGSAAATVPN